MRGTAMMMMSAMVLSGCILSACTADAPATVELKETPVLSGGLGWGVVTLSYVRLMREPSSLSADSGTARRGETGRIIARSRSFDGRDAGVWYRLELAAGTGWIHESALSVYRSEDEARKAAEAAQ